MQALRIAGLSEDGQTLVLVNEHGVRFALPIDERLWAAARGDITRLGQAQLELESQMRPREIQSRIRAGESVEQVAAASGMPLQRIERYAYPVLLERSRTAELAQRAHPIREDGPDVQTLGEVVAHGFGLRGQEYSSVAWDAWRGEDGRWIVQLRWRTGRSDNKAHWAFQPGAHGGTVIPLDDPALELLDPLAPRQLRTVRAITPLAQQAIELDGDTKILPVITDDMPPPPGLSADVSTAGQRYQPEPLPMATSHPAYQPQVESVDLPVQAVEAEQTVIDDGDKGKPPDGQALEQGRRSRKDHPIVPSWEDVLLGVRSQRG